MITSNSALVVFRTSSSQLPPPLSQAINWYLALVEHRVALYLSSNLGYARNCPVRCPRSKSTNKSCTQSKRVGAPEGGRRGPKILQIVGKEDRKPHPLLSHDVSSCPHYNSTLSFRVLAESGQHISRFPYAIHDETKYFPYERFVV